MNIEASSEELEALAGLLDAAVRWQGHVAAQGGLQAHGSASRSYQAVQVWVQKIEAAMKEDS
jgi:hypothetical protein